MLRSVPSTSTRPEVGAWNAHTRPISVDLPAPEGPTSAVTVPEAAASETPSSTGSPSRYAKPTSSKATWPCSSAERDRAARVVVLAPLAQQLARAVQPGERLAELGADRRDLQQRRHQEAEQHRVGEERAHASCGPPGSRRAPTYMTPAPTTPSSSVEASDSSDVPASVRNTLSSTRCDSRGEDRRPRGARPRTPSPRGCRASDSVSRPVTSA